MILSIEVFKSGDDVRLRFKPDVCLWYKLDDLRKRGKGHGGISHEILYETFVADGYSGLEVIDISDPTGPVIV